MKEKIKFDSLLILIFVSCITYLILNFIIKYVNKGVLG